MTVPTRLAKWREGAGLSVRSAARLLRISPDTYELFEAGEGECSASLAMDIFERTDGQVLPGDLPGCAVPATGSAASTMPGAVPFAAVDGATANAVVPSDFVSARAFARAGQVRVVFDDSTEDLWALTPRLAAELGMQMIRAALVAVGTDPRPMGEKNDGR